jgi:hypothetical protein
MAMLLDLYDRDILDQEGEPYLLRKANEDFFERVAGILPMHIKHLSREHLIRTLEVCVKRNIGSDRMYRDFLLLKIEKNMGKLSVDQYVRMMRALADKQYVEDNVFWNEYAFRYIHISAEKSISGQKDVPRTFTEDEARKLWDALIYLKLKCPSLDVKSHINYVETFMKYEQSGSAAEPLAA